MTLSWCIEQQRYSKSAPVHYVILRDWNARVLGPIEFLASILKDDWGSTEHRSKIETGYLHAYYCTLVDC